MLWVASPLSQKSRDRQDCKGERMVAGHHHNPGTRAYRGEQHSVLARGEEDTTMGGLRGV